MSGTLSWQQIYGGSGNQVAPPNPQGQAGTATASHSKGQSGGGGVAAGSVGWWLALLAGLVVIRVIYEVKGRVD